MKILDYINNNKDKYINLFCDMDGVLSEYDINNSFLILLYLRKIRQMALWLVCRIF